MIPIKFDEMNTTYATDQPEYLPLPVCLFSDGEVISCWQLSLFERFKILFTGKLWISNLTFNAALQPQLPTIDKPEQFKTKFKEIKNGN